MTVRSVAGAVGWEAAADALAAGSVVAIPTDTVYGLAARLDRPDALARIFELKDRPPALALPVLVANADQAQTVAAMWTGAAPRAAFHLWPGALTLVVPTDPATAASLGSEQPTVGIRCPDHDEVRDLCRRSGPLAVTSANPHGVAPCRSAMSVVETFVGTALALVVDGGECAGVPSTVVDVTGSEPVLLRPGGVAWEDVVAAVT